MTNDQEDYLSMSQTVISFLQDNTGIWQKNAALAAVVKEIDTENDTIVDNQSAQEATSHPATADKKKNRTGLEADTHMVSNTLSFCAAATGNTGLQEQVKPGTLDLVKYVGTKLIGIAKIILQVGTANLAIAQTYGLTQAMLDSLSKNLDAFTGNINAPRLAISSRANATDMIEDGIGTLHSLIEDKLDKGMALFTGTPFYNQYKIVRVMVHSPTRHLAMTGNFTDAAGQPLQSVTVTITNGTEKLRRKSSPLGNIRIKNLLDGEHVMTVEKPGFEDQEVKFTVAPPATTEMSVVMK